ncbi:hypothetical protein [Ectopseudomonas composti]|jgi:hypothetical protein|uniref:hypothetical protein n=1 Tax=Ectopseudomonas composti TaxID=658457 RepID=UPI00077444ED|nr:hypothetical protein [Pseudomonas composti]
MSQTHLLLSLPDAASSQRIARLVRQQAPLCQVIDSLDGCQQKPLCGWLQRLPAGSLGDVQSHLDDAIAVLEGTRHAFKSVQLAQLRKRLSQLREELSALGQCGKS